MQKSKVVIATTTFYGSVGETRAQLAFKTAAAVKDAGYILVVVDGSPDSQVKEGLERFGAIVHREEKPGIGNTRRQVFRKAYELCDSGNDIIVWMEPEKVTFVPYLKELAQALVNQNADLLVPEERA